MWKSWNYKPIQDPLRCFINREQCCQVSKTSYLNSSKVNLQRKHPRPTTFLHAACVYRCYCLIIYCYFNSLHAMFLRLPVISVVLKDKHLMCLKQHSNMPKHKGSERPAVTSECHESDQPLTAKGFVFLFSANQWCDKLHLWSPSSTGSSDWVSKAARGNLRSTKSIRGGEDQAEPTEKHSMNHMKTCSLYSCWCLIFTKVASISYKKICWIC